MSEGRENGKISSLPDEIEITEEGVEDDCGAAEGAEALGVLGVRTTWLEVSFCGFRGDQFPSS